MHLQNAARVQSSVLPQVVGLATETLNVYLDMLQRSWPLEGWAVLQKVGDDYRLLTSLGCFRALCPDNGFEQLLHQHWGGAAGYDDYVYRPLLEQETASLRSQTDEVLHVKYLFRVALHDTKGEVVGQLMGACADLPFYRWSTLCDHVATCITSMALMVALLDELGAAEVSLAAIKNASFYDAESGVLNRADWIYQLNISETANQVQSNNHTSIFVVRLPEVFQHSDNLSVRDVASLIKSLVRGEDVVGRIEKNTFAIIATHGNAFVTQRLQTRLAYTLGCDDDEVGVGAASCEEGATLSARMQLALERANEAIAASTSASKQAA